VTARRFPPPWLVEKEVAYCCVAATILTSKKLNNSAIFDNSLLSCVWRAGLRVVLNNLSEEVRESLQHAVDCAQVPLKLIQK
jgi:hypothetical protein